MNKLKAILKITFITTMATIKNNPHPYTSKDFSNFLLTKQARSVFVKYGFTFLGK